MRGGKSRTLRSRHRFRRRLTAMHGPTPGAAAPARRPRDLAGALRRSITRCTTFASRARRHALARIRRPANRPVRSHTRSWMDRRPRRNARQPSAGARWLGARRRLSAQRAPRGSNSRSGGGGKTRTSRTVERRALHVHSDRTPTGPLLGGQGAKRVRFDGLWRLNGGFVWRERQEREGANAQRRKGAKRLRWWVRGVVRRRNTSPTFFARSRVCAFARLRHCLSPTRHPAKDVSPYLAAAVVRDFFSSGAAPACSNAFATSSRLRQASRADPREWLETGDSRVLALTGCDCSSSR